MRSGNTGAAKRRPEWRISLVHIDSRGDVATDGATMQMNSVALKTWWQKLFIGIEFLTKLIKIIKLIERSERYETFDMARVESRTLLQALASDAYRTNV